MNEWDAWLWAFFIKNKTKQCVRQLDSNYAKHFFNYLYNYLLSTKIFPSAEIKQALHVPGHSPNHNTVPIETVSLMSGSYWYNSNE